MRYTKSLPRVLVKSSAVHSIGYDENEWVLQLKYINGDIWNYFRVPPREYHALLRADSIGGYVNRDIKPYYAYEKLESVAA
jgi:hypothetical protein